MQPRAHLLADPCTGGGFTQPRAHLLDDPCTRKSSGRGAASGHLPSLTRVPILSAHMLLIRRFLVTAAPKCYLAMRRQR